MPYIKLNRRIVITEKLQPVLNHIVSSIKNEDFQKGDLNYMISLLVREYVIQKGISYSSCSDITGVLNDVKVEFERRVVAPYEDIKIVENGDIYHGLNKETNNNDQKNE